MAQRWQGPWVWGACAALALCLAGLYPIDNSDTFGHLAAGRQIATLGEVPQVDTFSFWKAAPAPWTNYEWLSGWLMYEGLRHFGYEGLIVGKLLLLALCAVVLVRRGHAREGALGAGLTALLIVAAVPA